MKGIRILLFFLSASLTAQEVSIGLFYADAVQSFTVSPVRSRYVLFIDSIPSDTLCPGSILYISLMNDKLSIQRPDNPPVGCLTVELEALDTNGIFSIRPAFPAKEKRLYDDNVHFRADVNRILAVNRVQFDKYIAGVIESEGGTKAHPEYYKAQAVLCRTYALANITRHKEEGFDLCDGVHCQAYLSRSDKNGEILNAVRQTHGEVAVWNDTILITAAFHSNCGGETQSSTAEWVLDMPYLQPVRDPYCRESRNARWQKTFTLSEWKQYLTGAGIALTDSFPPSRFKFVQLQRKRFYPLGNDSLPLRKVRNDLGLRSSFFSVSFVPPDKIVLDGRGYGHGIGLCQEGAMQMALKGFDYREILFFYFTGISIKKWIQ